MVSLHEAVAEDSIQHVRKLIQEGSNVNEKSLPYQFTPLHVAALEGNEDIAHLLISNGAHTEEKDFHGRSPLHLAVLYNRIEFAKLLLKHKANVDATTNNSKTPLYFAVKKGYYRIAEVLVSNGAIAKIEYLILALREKKSKMAKLLIENGANVNGTANTEIPLHMATRMNNINLIRCFLRNKADPDLTGAGNPTQSAMCIAASKGRVETKR